MLQAAIPRGAKGARPNSPLIRPQELLTGTEFDIQRLAHSALQALADSLAAKYLPQGGHLPPRRWAFA